MWRAVRNVSSNTKGEGRDWTINSQKLTLSLFPLILLRWTFVLCRARPLFATLSFPFALPRLVRDILYTVPNKYRIRPSSFWQLSLQHKSRPPPLVLTPCLCSTALLCYSASCLFYASTCLQLYSPLPSRPVSPSELCSTPLLRASDPLHCPTSLLHGSAQQVSPHPNLFESAPLHLRDTSALHLCSSVAPGFCRCSPLPPLICFVAARLSHFRSPVPLPLSRAAVILLCTYLSPVLMPPACLLPLFLLLCSIAFLYTFTRRLICCCFSCVPSSLCTLLQLVTLLPVKPLTIFTSPRIAGACNNVLSVRPILPTLASCFATTASTSLSTMQISKTSYYPFSADGWSTLQLFNASMTPLSSQ